MRIVLSYPRFRDIHIKKDPGQIAYHLSRLGHDITILRINFEELSPLNNSYLSNNMRVVNIPSTSFLNKLINSQYFILVSNLLFSPLYLFYLVTLKPKILIGYFRESPILALLFYKLFFDRNSLIIIKLDADPRLWFTRRLRNIKYITAYLLLLLIYPSVSLFVIESPQAKEHLVKSFPFLKGKLLLMPNGVAEEYYQKLKDVNASPGIASEESEENVILFVGSVEYRKGVDILLKAFNIVKNEFPGWIVKIVGPITSIKYKCLLEKLVESLGLSDRVAFLGYLNDKDLVKEFLRSSIFVLPSRDEAFSIALVEAAFFGKPIISSNVGAAEYVLDYGKAGLLCGKDDVEGLARALKTMMASKELRVKLSERIKSRYSRLFSWKKSILKLSLIMNHLVLGKR